MHIGKKLKSKEVALIICFTVLYMYFSFIPAFPIIGSASKAITLAAIIAPIIGIILGPYLGMLSTILGGIIGWVFVASFAPPSFVSGVIAAVFAGMLYRNKRYPCALMYLTLLFLFGFYPAVGPVWLYPPFLWFQILGFLILISPLQSKALEGIRKFNSSSKYLFGFFIVFLNSTLMGQIAGSLTFEIFSSPLLISDISFWKGLWQFLAWLYPIERIIITLSSTFLGAFLCRVLIDQNLFFFPNWSEMIDDV